MHLESLPFVFCVTARNTNVYTTCQSTQWRSWFWLSLPIPFFFFSLFSYFLVCFFLIFVFTCDLYFDEGFGVGEGVVPRLGVKRIFVLNPTGRIWSVSKSELESGMKRFFSINKHKILVCWLTGNKKTKKQKNVKMEYDEFQHDGAPRPLGLSLFILLWFCLFFSLETCSFSWDLKWTHPRAVLVLPSSFQVL